MIHASPVSVPAKAGTQGAAAVLHRPGLLLPQEDGFDLTGNPGARA